MKIEHLVLAVAGLGKRLQPLTLNCPKALVKANGIPLIRYVLEEARGTSIRVITAVASPQHVPDFKRYFKEVAKDFPEFEFHIVTQRQPLGNGHAILQAAPIVKAKPFAVRFPDDLLFHKKPTLHSMLDIYEKIKAPFVLLQKVPKKEVSKYGVVAVRGGRRVEGGILYTVTGVVEKPPVDEAPSNLTAVGGYIFTPSIMRSLKKLATALRKRENDALPWVAAFEERIMHGEKMYGWQFPGTRLDCGALPGFRQAEKFLRQRAKTAKRQ